MTKIEVGRDRFNELLENAKRFWSPREQIGHSRNMVSADLLKSCKYIFIRDDGWSVASPEYASAHRLWAGDWNKLYILKEES